jgi:hypothetical protein
MEDTIKRVVSFFNRLHYCVRLRFCEMAQKRFIKRLETFGLKSLWNPFPLPPNVYFHRRNNEPS